MMSNGISEKVTSLMVCVYCQKMGDGSTSIDIGKTWTRLHIDNAEGTVSSMLTKSIGYFYDAYPERDGVDEQRSITMIIDFPDGNVIDWNWHKESKSGDWTPVEPSPLPAP